ncbi:MaoC family dehydratase [Pseudorhodoplanes sp.]|uniref:MaoC family dehydratase n=1 Tax=Pseudorhodoplanes sp. TaxID=1934341 RepID=UPI003D0E949B
MAKLYFEDFKPGHTAEYGPRLVTREEIIAFSVQYDPQPMHLDEAAAQKSLLGGLGASGWHGCGIMMRMICDGFLLDSTSMGAGGVEEVQWQRPIRPGDRLTLRVTILEARASKSRPDMGIVRFRYEMFNAHGEGVMTMVTPAMFGRRDPGAQE